MSYLHRLVLIAATLFAVSACVARHQQQDADLDALGRTDFLSRNEALRQEWMNYGRETPLDQWYEGQLAFLKNHNYFTPAARMLRNEMKKKNIAILEEKLRGTNSK